MARDRRRIGIQPVRVNLPRIASPGQAIVKTAATLADQEATRLADQRTQEANAAAAAIDFERDGDGNLLPPSLPISENGLLAPNIYDRAYTEMVSQRYLQQIRIDTNERLNLIATEHRFDPSAYREVAEGYVAKVTELAPESLKPDVNNTAQVTMVEHFNMIVREKAERDHDEARGIHAQTIENANRELVQYVESGASPDVIGGKMLEVRALIEQGDAFNYWLDDEKAAMLDGIDRSFAVANIVRIVNNMPDDELAHANAIQELTRFARGDGDIEMVDEAGNVAMVPVDEIPLNPEERQAIAEHGITLLEQKQSAFVNLKDRRLERDYNNFFNWFSPHALRQRSNGMPLDVDRLYSEFDEAHRNVVDNNYDDTLRETIRGIIEQEIMSGTGRDLSQEEQSFNEDLGAWLRMYATEEQKRLGDRDRSQLSPEELIELDFGITNDIGNVSTGNKQTAGNSRWISRYYSMFLGKDLEGANGRDYWNDVLQNPSSEKWDEINWMAKYKLSKIGLWPQELSAAIIGKLNDPEGMNQGSIESVTRLARIFWDNPTFKNNMTDGNALGHKVGRTLDHLFRYGEQPTPARVTELLEKFSDPNWSPNQSWNLRDAENKEHFLEVADSAIDRYFKASWRTAWRPTGVQAATFGFNPFDHDVAGIPDEVRTSVRDALVANAGFIDSNEPDMFEPIIHQTVRDILHAKGYATSEIGYSPVRFNMNYSAEWTRPDTAIVQRAPEYYAIDPITKTVDRQLMRRVESNFQSVLDYYGQQRNQKWKAGVNAALQYNGDASVMRGYPSWDVLLIREDSSYEILTEDGLFGGDRVQFDMREAIEWNKKQKEAVLRERQQRRAKLRTDYQTGQQLNPRMHGTQQ